MKNKSFYIALSTFVLSITPVAYQAAVYHGSYKALGLAITMGAILVCLIAIAALLAIFPKASAYSKPVLIGAGLFFLAGFSVCSFS